MSEGWHPGRNPASMNDSYLHLLEYREDLQRLCSRLTVDALTANHQAEARQEAGQSEDASQCRLLARKAARRALHVLWEYRATDGCLASGEKAGTSKKETFRKAAPCRPAPPGPPAPPHWR